MHANFVTTQHILNPISVQDQRKTLDSRKLHFFFEKFSKQTVAFDHDQYLTFCIEIHTDDPQ